MEEFFLDLILRLGFPVVVVLMMVKGYIVPGFVYERLVKDNERMVNVLEEKALPALIQSNEVLTELVPLIQEVKAKPKPRPRSSSGSTSARGK